MSPQELAELKTKDPFMYFSIPDVKDAILHVEAPVATPADNLEAAENENNQDVTSIVKRQTRHSFECHPDNHLDFDHMPNLGPGDAEADAGAGIDRDPFLSLLSRFGESLVESGEEQ